MTYDVVVIGAGSAGIAAAVAAADAGAQVLVLEAYGFAGGQATSALVGTLCGLHHRGGDAPRTVYGGFPGKFGQLLATASNTEPVCFDRDLWFLPYDPAAFQQLADQVLCQRKEISMSFHTTLSDVKISNGHLSELTTVSRAGRTVHHPNAVVDASGEAMVSVLAELPLQPKEPPQTGAVVFGLGGLPDIGLHALHLSMGTRIHQACDSGTLPSHCRRVSIVPGTLKSGTALIKLGLPHPPSSSPGALEVLARDAIRQVLDLLRQTPEFHGLSLTQTAAQCGIRSGSRPVGAVTLRGENVLQALTPPESVVQGAWPVEFWTEAPKPEMHYLEKGATYGIPAGALESGEVENLFFAGRALSADETAAASARVLGTCLATGTAAGTLAAAYTQGLDRTSTLDRIRLQLEVPHAS